MRFYYFALNLFSLKLNEADLLLSFVIQIYGSALLLSSLELNQSGLFLSYFCPSGFNLSLHFKITMLPRFALRLVKKFTGYLCLLN
jgi:hypothetical protein